MLSKPPSGGVVSSCWTLRSPSSHAQRMSAAVHTCFHISDKGNNINHSRRAASRSRPGTLRVQALGDSLPNFRPRKTAREHFGPRFELSAGEAVHLQLAALKQNNTPHSDHGIEVLYRFADFDPFARSTYFGKPADLGQFERFRRRFHDHLYRTLLNHEEAKVLSALQVSELQWRYRVRVEGYRRADIQVYVFNMSQRLGGIYDGYWFCASLLPFEST